jgi:hypothetical protein
VSLAQLLLEPTQLATENLARWEDDGVTVQLIDRITASSHGKTSRRLALAGRPSPPELAALLNLSRPAMLQHRLVRLSVSRGTVGVAYSAVVLDRIDEEERRRLRYTAGSLGRMLQQRGIRREAVPARFVDHDDPGTGVTEIRTVLWRKSRPVGFVHEKFFAQPVHRRR